MLEIKEEKFKFSCFGEEVEISYPTGDQVDATNEKLQDKESKGKELKVMRSLFIELGMKEEHVKKLHIDHYNKIFEALIQKKS